MPAPRLLIRLGSLGDVVLATAAANAEREVAGDACVDVLVKSEYAPLWEGHPAVRDLLAWSPAERDPKGLLALARRIRTRGYPGVVDLQSSPRTRLLTALAGHLRVSRPRRYALRRRLLVRTRRGGPPAGFRVAAAFAEAMRPGSTARPSLHPPGPARERARELVPDEGRRVGLVPGARHATKRWPLERYVETGRRLAAAGRGPVPVFFGPDEGDLRRRWTGLWPQDGTWAAVTEPLPVVAACMARLVAVVTNDTGLLHVSAAVDTPGVALFGPTVRSFGFEPAGDGHRVLSVDLPCRPCSVHGGPACPEGHFRCLLDISPERVLGAVGEVAGDPPRHDDRARDQG